MSHVDQILELTERGWRVFPLAPGSKTPAVNDWPNVATTDRAQIEAWWNDRLDLGVGIATGRASNLVVLDVDVAGGKQGDESLADLTNTYGVLPLTSEVITGTGGRHLYFRYPDGVELRNTAGRLGVDLDTRADGGYVVAPPSVHPDTGRAYEWELSSEWQPAEMPPWLVELLVGAATTKPREHRLPYTGSERPGDRFAAAHSWAELLTADGATYLGSRRDHRTGSDYELWARPGVDHVSATLYYGGTDVLKVFTPNWPGLRADETYTRYGYHVATRHGGDFAAATRALGEAERRNGPADWTLDPSLIDRSAAGDAATSGGALTETPARPDAAPSIFLDWESFWQADHGDHQWLAYPLIPAGRSIAIYAPAKAGKSTIVLDVVAAVATGRPILGATEPTEPEDVVYLDYEMTEADLQERLYEIGYGPDDDLSRFHYALLPSIPPLDTAAGAATLVQLATSVGAKLVVVDTFGRAVEGEEDKADTVRAFYRYTGLALKAAGIAVIRTDHSGKDPGKGARGSSAKADDVDVVWSLNRTDKGVRIKRTHSRVTWVPETVEIIKTEDESGIIRYVTAAEKQKAAPAGTAEKVQALDDLEAPVDISVNAAIKLLRHHGYTTSRDAAAAAVKERKQRATSWPYDDGTPDGTPEAAKERNGERNADGTNTKPDVAAGGMPNGMPRNAQAGLSPERPSPYRGTDGTGQPSDAAGRSLI